MKTSVGIIYSYSKNELQHFYMSAKFVQFKKIIYNNNQH